MEIKIKTKRIDGNLIYGVIDNERNIVIDFDYNNIKKYDDFLLCERSDDTWDLYHLGYNDIIIHVLNQDSGYELLEKIDKDEFIARKNEKVGIIRIECWNGFSKISSAYRFGKADEIIKENDGIKLIKHQKNGNNLIGFYNDKIYGTLDPEYISIEKRKYSMGHLPTLPYNQNFRNESYFANVIYYLKVSKIKNGKRLYGVKQLVLKQGKFILEAFLPCEYTKIEPKDKQIIKLEKEINGEKKVGFTCYELKWEMRYNYGWVGYPHFRSLINEDCTYDDIKTIYDDFYQNSLYIKLIKNGKESIKYISFLDESGDFYDDPCHLIERTNKCFLHNIPDNKFYNEIEQISFNLFLGKKDLGADILLHYTNSDKDIIVIPGNYVSISSVKINRLGYYCYIATNNEGKKQFINFSAPGIIQSNFYKDIIFFGNDAHNIGFIGINDDGTKDCYIVHEGFMECKPCCKLIKKDIKEVYIKDNFYEIHDKNSCKKQIYSIYNDLLFECNKNDIVEYITSPWIYKVTNSENNTILKLCGEIEDNDENYKHLKNIIEQNVFTDVKINEKGQIICDYVSKNDNDFNLVRYLSNIDFSQGKIKELFKGLFFVKNYTKDLSRVIISIFDKNSSTCKFGVIETNKGNVIIPFDYSNISYNEESDSFTCETFNYDNYEMDKDGFEVIKDNILSKNDVSIKKLNKD